RSTIKSASSLALAGTPAHWNAGDTSSPSHVYRRGSRAALMTYGVTSSIVLGADGTATGCELHAANAPSTAAMASPRRTAPTLARPPRLRLRAPLRARRPGAAR